MNSLKKYSLFFVHVAYFGESDHLFRWKRPVIGALATPVSS